MISVNVEKDIGVIFDEKLNFKDEMSTHINKANCIMGVIRCTYSYLDAESFKLQALVRPHLEYGVPVWYPRLKMDIEALERVQRRATKATSKPPKSSIP
ncbi:hypothetical protein NHX12_010673 [Muraenolepis orangiensis]|uniref:Uncharacterized protein n=1 Tax=Muraenolepis orangiensis TaxID=630683 RepID=A0A9Q0DNN4_9TELE|nr:hypothetical protein NHX12_010673 [Muraenolepis orangiensis]